MNGAIGETLPFALAIAVSPIPIIAAILMLLSPGARGNAIGFLAGWIAGVTLVVVVFTLISGLIGPAKGGTSPVVGVIKIVLGVLMLLRAIRQLRRRLPHGTESAMPKWMSAIDKMSVGRALGLGLLLSALNPKNLMMSISAGVTFGSAGLSVGEIVLAILIFVVVAVSTIAVPVIAYLAASDRMAASLQRLRGWLVENNPLIVSLLLLVLGVVSIGKGIAAL